MSGGQSVTFCATLLALVSLSACCLPGIPGLSSLSVLSGAGGMGDALSALSGGAGGGLSALSGGGLSNRLAKRREGRLASLMGKGLSPNAAGIPSGDGLNALSSGDNNDIGSSSLAVAQAASGSKDGKSFANAAAAAESFSGRKSLLGGRRNSPLDGGRKSPLGGGGWPFGGRPSRLGGGGPKNDKKQGDAATPAPATDGPEASPADGGSPTNNPDAAGSPTNKPDAAGSDANSPDGASPDANNPNAPSTDANNPDSATPATDNPDAAGTDIGNAGPINPSAGNLDKDALSQKNPDLSGLGSNPDSLNAGNIKGDDFGKGIPTAPVGNDPAPDIGGIDKTGSSEVIRRSNPDLGKGRDISSPVGNAPIGSGDNLGVPQPGFGSSEEITKSGAFAHASSMQDETQKVSEADAGSYSEKVKKTQFSLPSGPSQTGITNDAGKSFGGISGLDAANSDSGSSDLVSEKPVRSKKPKPKRYRKKKVTPQGGTDPFSGMTKFGF